MKPAKTSFNRRKFVSVGLLFTASSLVATGILIEILEALEYAFPMHFCTAVHALTGLAFAVFAVFHTTGNWRSLKAHLKNAKATAVSKEVIVALSMGIMVVFIGFLLAHSVF
ncbi:MAG: hypothetical protein LBR10_02485 [Prevotellaceae bacterium]|jgi:hypothetical protein|nr:hypothetical protein [Prevotellaceae bacterium]